MALIEAILNIFLQRSEAVVDALAAIQQYGLAIAALNNDGAYADLSQHAQWLPALRAAASLQDPVAMPSGPEGYSSQAVEAVATWRVLKVYFSITAALSHMLQETQATLQRERIDVALATADAKERLIEAARSAAPAQLARALGTFTASQATIAENLSFSAPGAGVLDGLQQLVLGYASVIITSRDAADVAGNAPWLMDATSWLTTAVQIADSIGSLAGELQLVVPSCAALLAAGPAEMAVLQDAFDALEDSLDGMFNALNENSDTLEDSSQVISTVMESGAEQIMNQLLEMSGRWQALGVMLQCLQSVRAAAGSLNSSVVNNNTPFISLEVAEEASGPVLKRLLENVGDPSSIVNTSVWEWLHLAALAIDTWQGMTTIWPSDDELMKDDTVLISAWEGLSHAAAAAVSGTVQGAFLPALQAAMETSVDELANLAATLPATSTLKISNLGGAVGSVASPFTSSTPSGGARGLGVDERGSLSTSAFGGLPPLPAFFDFVDAGEVSRGGASQSGLLLLEEESLGGGDVLMTNEESQLEKESTFAGEDDLDSGSSTVENISSLLSSCADTAGALAAVDAVLHVSATTAQHGAQQAQQARLDLSVHQWRYEPLLLTILSPKDLSTLPDLETNSSTNAAGTTSLLPPSVAELSASALKAPRHELLDTLKGSITALDAAEISVASWHQLETPAQREIINDLGRIAPQAMENLRACMNNMRDWDRGAANNARQVRDTLEALLDFELSREVKEESGMEWKQYREAVQRVHAVHAASIEAETALAQAQSELEVLRASREEALLAKRGAEESGTAATARLSRYALPLVKATQKLPTSLQELITAVEDLSSKVELLNRLQRRLNRLQSARTPHTQATSTTSEVEAKLSEAISALSTGMGTLQELPRALEKLHRFVHLAKRGLQQGGRGEAAAREQAGDVVMTIKGAIADIAPLVRNYLIK